MCPINNKICCYRVLQPKDHKTEKSKHIYLSNSIDESITHFNHIINEQYPDFISNKSVKYIFEAKNY
jgi:hypothetical protein